MSGEGASSRRSRVSGCLWRLIGVVVGGAVLLIVVPLVLLWMGIRWNCENYRDVLNRELSDAAGRSVVIEGGISLELSLRPHLVVEDVVVSNPPDWQGGGEFARLERFTSRVGLVEWLRNEVTIDDLQVKGLRVALLERPGGQKNWVGILRKDLSGQSPGASADPDGQEGLQLTFTELRSLRIEDIDVSHHAADDSKVRFWLEELQGEANAGRPIRLALRGGVDELSLAGTIEGDPLKTLMNSALPWGWHADLVINQAKVGLEGRFPPQGASQPSTLAFSVAVDDLQAWAPLIGQVPSLGAIAARGQLEVASWQQWTFSALEGSIGETALKASVSVDLSGTLPRLEGEIDVSELDLAAFERQAKAEGGSETGSLVPGGDGSSGESLLPVVGKFRLGIAEVKGVVANTSVRDLQLHMNASPSEASADLSVRFAGAPLGGKLRVKTVEDRLVDVSLELEGEDADVSNLVNYYTGNDRFRGRFSRLNYSIGGRGKTILDAFRRRQVSLVVEGAEVSYQLPNEQLRFTIARGVAQHGHEVDGVFHAKGKLADVGESYDLRLGYRSGGNGDRWRYQLRSLAGRVADFDIEVENLQPEQGVAKGLDWRLVLAGKRLDRLNSIYRLNLPPLGPYHLAARLEKSAQQITLSDLDVKVGTSGGVGKVKVDWSSTPATWNVALRSRLIRLEDFGFPGWSPGRLTKGKASVKGNMSNQAFLTHKSLAGIDLVLDLRVNDVRSRADRLGSGSVKLTLRDGLLDISQVSLGLPGGKFDGALSYRPRPTGRVDWRLRLSARKFDYGIIARRYNPKSELRGVLNIDADLRSERAVQAVPSLSEATGSLKVNVCPEAFGAETLDLWATNLLFALLPRLDPRDESVVNCLVGEFSVANGVLTSQQLGLDTTRMRVLGQGTIDLKNDRVKLKLTPVPKRPQLFSVEVPVGIGGTLQDPSVEMGPLPVINSLLRMTTNTLLFPLNSLAGKRLPEDGSDICGCSDTRTKPAVRSPRSPRR